MKMIKSVLSSRRLRSPAKSEPDMMSKTRLHVAPATGGELDESRAAAETTNESDESRTTAATANEFELMAAVDASIKPSEPDESQVPLQLQASQVFSLCFLVLFQKHGVLEMIFHASLLKMLESLLKKLET